MSEHPNETSEQYGRSGGSGQIGGGQRDPIPSINPAATAEAPRYTTEHRGPSHQPRAGAGGSGQSTEATMGAAPHPSYPCNNSHGAMGYPPYPPGMAAAYPPPLVTVHPGHNPGAGYYAPPAGMYPQYPPAGAYYGGQPQAAGAHAGQGVPPAGQGMHSGMSQFVEEISNGGSGLSSLGKMLNLDDSEFWKGALIGAAAVLLLTNESVQNMLLKTGAKAKEAVKSGVEKVKETASAEKAKEQHGDE